MRWRVAGTLAGRAGDGFSGNPSLARPANVRSFRQRLMAKARRVRLAEPMIEFGVLHVFDDDAAFMYEGNFHERRREEGTEHDTLTRIHA